MSYTKIHNQPKGVKKNQNEPKRTKSIQKRQNKKKRQKQPKQAEARYCSPQTATATRDYNTTQPGRSVQSYD